MYTGTLIIDVSLPEQVSFVCVRLEWHVDAVCVSCYDQEVLGLTVA